MTAKEFHDQITAWVEDHSNGNQPNNTETPCDDCRTTFERELNTRMKVGERTITDPIPEARQLEKSSVATGTLSTATSSVLRSATSDSTNGASSKLAVWGMIASVGLMLAGVILLLNRGEEPSTTLPIQSPTRPSTPNGKPVPALNFFNATTSNFAAIAGGKVKPEIETESKEELAAFFKEQGVDYAVKFPTTSLALVGGFVSKHGDASVAHLVYRSGERTMYMFQIPWGLLQQGKSFYVTQDAAQKMEAGEKLMESSDSTQSLSIGKYGDLAIAIAANVSKGELESLIKW